MPALIQNIPILSTIIFLPLFGAIALLLIKHETWIKYLTLMVCGIDLLLSIVLILSFDTSTYLMQFQEIHAWVPAFNIHYALGIDGINVLFANTSATLASCVLNFPGIFISHSWHSCDPSS